MRSGRIQLKNVHGEKNAADISMKHSNLRDKLEKLDELYDCEFRDGRPAMAPATHTGQMERATITEADVEGAAKRKLRRGNGGETAEDGICDFYDPVMPHNVLAGELSPMRTPILW